MIRCAISSEKWATPTVELDEAESKHLASVLRVQAGDPIEVLDGAGTLGTAEILSPHKKHTTIRILTKTTIPPSAPLRILAQALVREQKMDWLIQKAVELGVSEIWPLQTERAIVKIRPEEAAKKVARWQAIALAACKQSGNPWLPKIMPVRSLCDTLRAPPQGPACFGALQEGAIPLPQFFERHHAEGAQSITAYIGPEGDFSPAEVAALCAAGVQPVTFGPIVLRVETAALFFLSALQYAWMKPS